MTKNARSKYPSHIGIETANICNCQCIICPLFQGQDMMRRELRSAATMSNDIFAKIVDEVASWPEKPTLFLNIFGEPLLDKNLPKKLSMLKERGLGSHVYLQTNAMLLYGEIAESILDNGVGCLVPCFDSYRPEVFEKIRSGAKFSQVLDNIMNFAMMRNRKKSCTKIAIQHVRTFINKDDHKQVYNLFNPVFRNGDVLNITTSHYWATQSLKNSFRALAENKDMQVGYSCPMLSNWINIGVDGNALVCCFDYNFDNFSGNHNIYNINNSSLMEIWNSDFYESLQQRIASGKNLPYRCAQCSNLFATPYMYNNEIFDYEAELCNAGSHAVIVSFRDN